MKRLIYTVLCFLTLLTLAATPDKVRLISIGLDYANSPSEDMLLYGTVNDASAMSAALGNIMQAKGVEFESIMMLQEGKGDYFVEITVSAKDDLRALVDDVEEILVSLNPDSEDATEYELDDETYLIRDRIADAGTLDALYDEIASFDAGDGSVDFDFFDIKDTPLYPSADNILTQILLSSDLDYDDLLVVYYSGHGGSEDAFTRFSMGELLKPYVEDGRITAEQRDAVLKLDVIITDCVMDTLIRLDVDEETILDIAEKMDNSTDTYKTGVLATAYTYDNYYADCTSLEMYMLYVTLSFLKCDSVLILDSCYSGFAADNLIEYLDASEYDHAVNIEVMSASTKEETSEEYGVELDNGDYDDHGAFTLAVLSKLGWELSAEKTTTITVPFYTIDSDGSVVDIGIDREVNGYTAFIPSRQTASEFFASVIADWDAEAQHPVAGESEYLLYFIP